MRYYAQVVAEAAQATPPMVRGLIRGDRIWRLVSWEGDGGSRVFTFDLIGEVTYRQLIRDRDKVALLVPDAFEDRVSTPVTKRRSVRCPGCGLSCAGEDFWPHYNLFHARREWWPNREHWKSLGLREPYVAPPEQR